MTLPAGARLGRYEIRSPIGAFGGRADGGKRKSLGDASL